MQKGCCGRVDVDEGDSNSVPYKQIGDGILQESLAVESQREKSRTEVDKSMQRDTASITRHQVSSFKRFTVTAEWQPATTTSRDD